MVTATKTEAPRERPILFSGPMIRAILAGRKTMTRRVVKPQPEVRGTMHNPEGAPAWYWKSPKLDAGYCHTGEEPMRRLMATRSPYGIPGDRLWVRETWGPVDFMVGVELEDPVCVGYQADETARRHGHRGSSALDTYAWNWAKVRWRPSIHMPRWASRLTLEVTGVRVERLQAITDADARAEGVEPLWLQEGQPGAWFTTNPEAGPDLQARTPADAFRKLWQAINGERPGCSWDNNPWVWVVSFRRLS